jgi:hypothetical protein
MQMSEPSNEPLGTSRTDTNARERTKKGKSGLGPNIVRLRFLFLGNRLSLVELDYCSVVDLLTSWTGPKDLLVDDEVLPMTYEGPSCPNKNNPTTKQCWSSIDDSAPSEARKRGSGGGSPRRVR